ncbi:hypothetical protein MAPG_07574 [Magnaporthiopsis poae ATCC 64411]|uniref:GPI inositol-deacylase n=1 Tax=Magnaporthiopsis poae (strain ATCC 64411 / 73-15) TaxID=644358 RepID=A0A0C4E515_MAGP6|nr:hypothetical protein MAPG_07574 [Magnaporthiopsis poae ATCC 64411]
MWKRIKGRRHRSPSHAESSQTSTAPSQPSCEVSAPAPDRFTELPRRGPVSQSISDSQRRPSALSDVYAQLQTSLSSSSRQKQRTQDRSNDPLGLTILHTPEAEREVDIVFLHGLGGTSRRTWCRDRDLDNFWPQLWLPHALPTARVLTFGYNAHFSSRKEQASSTIGDFAADLLFRMKYGETTPERLGQVPIVIVAHSMGGLVFKKAFVEGHSNDQYKSIVTMVKGVVFLATPHRGTDLAETLNKLLAGSVFGHSSREYVKELARKSPTIDEIDKAFRHHAPKLEIFSFYETLSTAVGPASFMIVETAAAVTGLPTETKIPLNADHHNACKFTSPEDPNYVSILGALRSIVTSASPASAKRGENTKKDIQHLADLLGIAGPPDEDLASYRASRKQGTCERFIESPEFDKWLQSTQSCVLWAHAEPGNGKSITCSSVVDHLNGAGHSCSYYFFKYGQRQKKSASHMLLSLAYQTALQLNEFREVLVDLAKAGVCVSEADAKTVWESIFKSVLATVKTEKTIFWVIDGLDEADSSNQVVEQLSAVADFDSHMVRILVFSRPLESIHRAFQAARKKIGVVETPLPDNRDDIRLSVTDQVNHLICGDEFKLELVDEIVARSHGSFLWASLVGKAVIGKTREDQVRQVLRSTPDDMGQLYDRMMATVTAPSMEEDKKLARALMTCAMFAKTPVTVDEFLELYPAETKDIMDLSHTVSQVCGQFVVVAHGWVELVHHSAREYLMREKDALFSSDPRGANEDLLIKCLATLCDKTLRQKLSRLNPPKPLHYSSAFWPDHLQEASIGSARVLKALVMFFNGPYPLVWIQYLAMTSRLSELPGASRKLSGYLQKCAKLDGSGSPLPHRPEDVSLLESWAVDLMKLPAKFGPYLLEDPTLIYKCVPALCPTSSIIHQKFSAGPGASLFVSGLSESSWGDCLARISADASYLATSSLYLALASDAIRIYGTALFEERMVLDLGERAVTGAVAFNKPGTLLAAYTRSRTFVWKSADWSLLLSVDNPEEDWAIEFKFDESDNLFMISDVREVYKLSTQQGDAAVWSALSRELLEEKRVPGGPFIGTPSSVAFNSDCSHIAVAYRTFPLSIWSVEPPEMITRLQREGRPGRGGVHSHTGTNCHVWHPSGEILGTHDGQLFKWDHVTDTYEQKKSDDCAHGVTCSPNGQVFLVDYGGPISIFDFATMSVLYKLVAEGPTQHAVFSPNGARLYHTTPGGTCKVWEPDCLRRLADAAPVGIAGSDSEDDRMDSPRPPTPLSSSDGRADGRMRVDLLAIGRSSSDPVAYATNEAEAAVFVYDPPTRKTHEVDRWSWRRSHIDALSWNLGQNRLAYVSNSNRITIKSITFGSTAERPLSVETVLEVPARGVGRKATQVLFNRVGDRLFVSQDNNICRVLSVPDGTVMAEAKLAYSRLGRWQQHPREWTHLVCFTLEAAMIISWDDLEQKGRIPLDIPKTITGKGGDAYPPAVDAILESYGPQYVLLRTRDGGYLSRYRFFVLPAESIYKLKHPIASGSSPTQEEVAVRPLELPESLVANIKHGFGILSEGVLLFLDKRHWVCSISLSSPTKETRVFFLPNDWVTDRDLRLCRLQRGGALLCPSKGEVAIFKWA